MLLYLMASPDLSSGLQHNSIRLGILDSIRDKDYSHSLRLMCYRMVYHKVSVFYSSGSSTLSLQRLSIVVMKENSAPVQIFYDYELNSLADQLFPTSSRLLFLACPSRKIYTKEEAKVSMDNYYRLWAHPKYHHKWLTIGNNNYQTPLPLWLLFLSVHLSFTGIISIFHPL